MLVELPEPLLRKTLAAVNQLLTRTEKRLMWGHEKQEASRRAANLLRDCKVVLEAALHNGNGRAPHGAEGQHHAPRP